MNGFLKYIIVVLEKEKVTKVNSFYDYLCRIEYINSTLIRFPTSIDGQFCNNELPYDITYLTIDELVGQETAFSKNTIIFIEGYSRLISKDTIKERKLKEIKNINELKKLVKNIEDFFFPLQITEKDINKLCCKSEIDRLVENKKIEYRKKLEDTIYKCLKLNHPTVVFDETIFCAVKKSSESKIFFGDENQQTSLVNDVLNSLSLKYDTSKEDTKYSIELPNNRIIDPMMYVINKREGLYDYNVRSILDGYAEFSEYKSRERQINNLIPQIIRKSFIKFKQDEMIVCIPSINNTNEILNSEPKLSKEFKKKNIRTVFKNTNNYAQYEIANSDDDLYEILRLELDRLKDKQFLSSLFLWYSIPSYSPYVRTNSVDITNMEKLNLELKNNLNSI